MKNDSFFYFLNGHYVNNETARISPQDLGLLRGFGVFDFLRTYHGRPFHLQEHLLRLRYSASKLSLAFPYSDEEIADIISVLMKKNNTPEAMIKIIVTGGESLDHITLGPSSTILVMVYPAVECPNEHFQKGVSIITFSGERFFPSVKSLNYIAGILALQKARKNNAEEALYVNTQNMVLEAATCNFFIFYRDKLITPKKGILKGITREIVLHLAKKLMPVEEGTIYMEELKEAKEAFITSSVREVMPVIQIDEIPIGEGIVGPNTKILMQAFREYTEKNHWPTLSMEFESEKYSHV